MLGCEVIHEENFLSPVVGIAKDTDLTTTTSSFTDFFLSVHVTKIFVLLETITCLIFSLKSNRQGSSQDSHKGHRPRNY